MRIILKATIDDSRFITLEALPKILDLINNYFTYNDMSLCFMGGSFKRKNIRKRKFLIIDKNIETIALIPIGFKKELEDFLIKNNATYKFTDNRVLDNFIISDEEIKNNLQNFTLYDFQVDAVKACLREKGGIVKSPTGSGKTLIFISLCNIMKKKSLILFARIDLANQTLRRMKEAGLDAGIVQGNNIDEDHQIVMATVQSAHKLKNKYEMVICDEAHRVTAEQYQNVLKAKMFKYRFGFSATPWTKDKYKNARVKSFIGDEIFDVHPKVLIESKKIAKPNINIYPVDRPRGLENYKWMGAERHGIINNKYRNKLITKLCENVKGQILILVKKIDQGKTLKEMIDNSFFLWGDSDIKEREEIVKRFEKGEEFVLIASTIFDEGIDLQNVNHVFIAGGGSSFIKTLQRVGRGTRITKDKKEVDIYDFWDNINPTLLRHSMSRVKTYRQYGFEEIIFHEDREVKKLLI